MPSDIRSILSLEVPLIVVLGQRSMKTSDVVSLIPGAIIELPKKVDEELTLLVNNRPVGTGAAVKVGENFGLRVNFIGDLQQRIVALAGVAPSEPGSPSPDAGADQFGTATDALVAAQA